MSMNVYSYVNFLFYQRGKFWMLIYQTGFCFRERIFSNPDFYGTVRSKIWSQIGKIYMKMKSEKIEKVENLKEKLTMSS